jgi:hypothetical protein
MPDPTHWTLKPAGTKKYQGTYFRRLEDIEAGLIRIYDSPMPEGGRFLYLYYGCEKLGRGIVGIHNMWDCEGRLRPIATAPSQQTQNGSGQHEAGHS